MCLGDDMRDFRIGIGGSLALSVIVIGKGISMDDKKDKKGKNPFEEFISNLLGNQYICKFVHPTIIGMMASLPLMDETMWAGKLNARQDQIRQCLAEILGDHFKHLFEEKLKDVDEEVITAMVGISATLAYIADPFVKEVIEADDFWADDIDWS
jgi:hypothetical protein